MRHYILGLLTMLVAFSVVAADDDDYQPLVREGVRWHYSEQNATFLILDTMMYGPIKSYTLELKNDTTVTWETGEKKTYLRLFYSDHESSPSGTAYYLREENKKVYQIVFPQNRRVRSGDETLLYDFSSENRARAKNRNFNYIGETDVNGKSCRTFRRKHTYTYMSAYSLPYYIWLVESIGLVSYSFGDLNSINWSRDTGWNTNRGLDYVEDSSGNIIYRSPWLTQPTVREGVRWVYGMREKGNGGQQCFYQYEFKDDVKLQVGFPAYGYLESDTFGPCYFPEWHAFKKCYRTLISGSVSEFEGISPDAFSTEEPAAYLRQPEEFFEPVVPCVMMNDLVRGKIDYEKEPRQYDVYHFSSNMEQYPEDRQATMNPDGEHYGIATNMQSFALQGFADIDGKSCHVFHGDRGDLVETVGFVSADAGDLLTLLPEDSDIEIGLSHVEDADGNIIYRGPWYAQYCSVASVRDVKPADPRWYDLMGRAFEGKPTQPGVYVHQGQKVVVR